MSKNEMIETLKYYTTQLENAEKDANDANMSVDEVTEIIRKNIIDELTK